MGRRSVPTSRRLPRRHTPRLAPSTAARAPSTAAALLYRQALQGQARHLLPQGQGRGLAGALGVQAASARRRVRPLLGRHARSGPVRGARVVVAGPRAPLRRQRSSAVRGQDRRNRPAGDGAGAAGAPAQLWRVAPGVGGGSCGPPPECTPHPVVNPPPTQLPRLRAWSRSRAISPILPSPRACSRSSAMVRRSGWRT